MKNYTILLMFLLSVNSFSQVTTSQNIITITGDSLVGRNVNGETLREVIGNVVLIQGNVRITCNKAIQYIARNDAILEGNVIITQDTLTIETERGFYYGDERLAQCSTGVRLNDGNVILEAINGDYYFNESRAFFSDDVRMYDTVSTLTSDKLTYFKNEQKMIAVGNVEIRDSINTINSDSLVHFRIDKITFAESNVKITSSDNNTEIFGDHLENYSKREYTIITGNPFLFQVDTSGVEIDTLMISSHVMESFNDSSQKFIAKDSVRIWRGDFASNNRYTIYLRSLDKIITYKQQPEEQFPVMWYQQSQLTGDSIVTYVSDNDLDSISVFNNALILSHHEIYSSRFDQISGNRILMCFDSSAIDFTNVYGDVLSIYYMYEENEPNGLAKSSSQRARILFKDNRVSEVRLYGSPISEYYPENKVSGQELSFTLPSFILFKDRPEKNEMLKNVRRGEQR